MNEKENTIAIFKKSISTISETATIITSNLFACSHFILLAVSM